MNPKITTLVIIVMVNGCLCIPEETTTTTTQPELICNKPYIRVGDGCCLDRDDDRICDGDEAPTTVVTTTEPTTTFVTTTTYLTTTMAKRMRYSCVNKYNVSSDTVLYIYTKSCCDPVLTSRVRIVESGGYNFEYIDLGEITPRQNALIECFTKDLTFVPLFICPANGKMEIVTSADAITTKVKNFAKECNESAWV